MRVLYVLDNTDMHIKWFSRYETYQFVRDIEYTEQSTVTVAQEPDITNDDLVLCKDGDRDVFLGVCKNCSRKNGAWTITLRQTECLFDRMIILDHEDLIQSTGIEDFIVQAIRDNWTESGDITDKSYLTVTALTHTPINASVEAHDGIFNLKTYLGNAKQHYRIYLDWTITNGALSIAIRKDTTPDAALDVEANIISDFSETYSVDVLAKLEVLWQQPDVYGEDGEVIVGAVSRRNFYLLADRAITQDATDPDRAAGTARAIHIQASTEDELLQAVQNEFTANSYQHSISLKILKENRAYPVDAYYMGRPCSLKTKYGVKTSIITRWEEKSGSAYIGLSFGKLPIKLIDKIRR